MVPDSEAVYPVRIVLRRTGLSAELLRAWERRYGVVAPARTAGGQRLYSETEVQRLELLRRATLHGHSISRIAELDNADVAALLATEPEPRGSDGEPLGEPAAAILRPALAAVHEMDGATLDAVLRRAAVSMGPVSFAETVVAPLVGEIGDLWHRGQLRIVQEHLATTTIRQVLSGLLAFTPAATDGPVFAVGTTSGQRHELGAMLVATVAAARGWHAVYLGPDLPGEEIGIAATRLGAQAIGLSLVYPDEGDTMAIDLAAVARLVGPAIPRYVGGRAVSHHLTLLERHGFIPVETLQDLDARLATTS
jgi:DNA-binding transcriptional MerR regulator/methylmalonyl-CoA mutase cobalamin-binding subunit